MEFILAPTITVMASSVPTGEAIDLVPDHDHEMETICAVGSKVCYDAHGKDGRAVSANVSRCVSERHFSVLEHATITFLVVGISRGLSHEFVRHRHLSFSQRSTRYTEEGTERVVLEPRILEAYSVAKTEGPEDEELSKEDSQLCDEWINYNLSLTQSFKHYRKDVELKMLRAPSHLSATEKRKWARGAARQLLPHALETQLVVTGNLRTWREFLVLRSGRGAEAEIRRLSNAIGETLLNHAPNALHDFEVQHIDGFDEYTLRK